MFAAKPEPNNTPTGQHSDQPVVGPTGSVEKAANAPTPSASDGRGSIYRGARLPKIPFIRPIADLSLLEIGGGTGDRVSPADVVLVQKESPTILKQLPASMRILLMSKLFLFRGFSLARQNRKYNQLPHSDPREFLDSEQPKDAEPDRSINCELMVSFCWTGHVFAIVGPYRMDGSPLGKLHFVKWRPHESETWSEAEKAQAIKKFGIDRHAITFTFSLTAEDQKRLDAKVEDLRRCEKSSKHGKFVSQWGSTPRIANWSFERLVGFFGCAEAAFGLLHDLGFRLPQRDKFPYRSDDYQNHTGTERAPLPAWAGILPASSMCWLIESASGRHKEWLPINAEGRRTPVQCHNPQREDLVDALKRAERIRDISLSVPFFFRMILPF